MRLQDYLKEEEDARTAERERLQLLDILTMIGNSYPNDPGTSDLDDEQPVSVSMTLKEVRFAWRMLR